jgi:hypothetical protein
MNCYNFTDAEAVATRRQLFLEEHGDSEGGFQDIYRNYIAQYTKQRQEATTWSEDQGQGAGRRLLSAADVSFACLCCACVCTSICMRCSSAITECPSCQQALHSVPEL